MTSVETLRAVHHPMRRRLIEYLGLRGPSQVTTLAEALGAQVGSISHHLRMLERVGLVERAPELATDARTSWWRPAADSRISWSVDDFADNAADRMAAKAAERLNLDYQLGKLATWKKHADRASHDWREAAFSSDTSALASAEELARLQEMLHATLDAWRESLEDQGARDGVSNGGHEDDVADGDDGDAGAERRPVFVFAYGFPSRP